MKSKIEQLAQETLPEVQRIRRHLHAHPELGHEEFETQKLVMETLDALGIPNHPLAGTGVVGLIEGAHPGKTVLLRGDMDALPIHELADVPYKSTVDGLMHACGHDGHTAGLLGAAMILNQMKDDIHGNVKLMFQPAEETDGGADPMIQAGLLENPTVEAAFGLHLAGHLPHGTLQVRYGAMYGAPDEFELVIHGKGGHAASPEQTIDPIAIAVQIISNAQFLLTRRLDPMKPAVISFTKIQAGEGLNVIPETCHIGGTIRTLYPDTRAFVSEQLEALIAAQCELHGATYSFNFMPSYPPLINDTAMTDLAKRALQAQMGDDAVSDAPFASLGAEDFAFLAQAVPSSYYLLGIHEEGKPMPVHHHPEFAWNDDVLAISSATLARVALEYLNAQ